MGEFNVRFLDHNNNNGLVWFNLSKWIGENLPIGPDRDINNLHVSIISDATGTTITVTDTISADGYNEMPEYLLEDPTILLPELSYTYGDRMLIRGTVVTPASTGSLYRQGLGWMRNSAALSNYYCE